MKGSPRVRLRSALQRQEGARRGSSGAIQISVRRRGQLSSSRVRKGGGVGREWRSSSRLGGGVAAVRGLGPETTCEGVESELWYESEGTCVRAMMGVCLDGSRSERGEVGVR